MIHWLWSHKADVALGSAVVAASLAAWFLLGRQSRPDEADAVKVIAPARSACCELVVAEAATSARKVNWLVSGSKHQIASREAKKITILPQENGSIRLIAAAVSGGELATDEATIIVGTPRPPDPPGPRPPEPPPTPPPSPAPIPGEGLRVLIVYESEDTLSAKYKAVIYSKTVRDYLNRKCAKGPDGTPERRMYDKDTDVSADSKVWQDAMKRSRASLPWIIVSNGREGAEQGLPDDVDSVMALLRKYGGD